MRIILKLLLAIIIVALGITSAMQAFTNIYNFSPSRQFNGEKVCNPYQGIVADNWKKANFHAHQRYIFFGLEFDYSSQELQEAYKDQGYDIVGISDHQQINKAGAFPSYEHGMGINEFHVLMLGAREVTWFNDPLMVWPEHQIQTMVERLKGKARLIGINHTSRHRFASAKVFDNIMGYDLSEMNPDLNSQAWDRALSNGIHSTLVANDDTHTITDRSHWFQRTFTMINVPAINENEIISALKDGRSYGVYVSQEQNQKENPHQGLPKINDISLVNDTIAVIFSTIPDSVRFIGQDAKVLATVMPTDSLQAAIYKFGQSDTYVRVDAYFSNGSRIWTNPFYRQGGSVREAATVNTFLTVLNAIGWGVVTLIFLRLLIRVFKRKKVDYDSYYR